MRRIDVPSRKRKPTDAEHSVEDVKNKKTSKQKSKREPLPMKMRAFPSSFWQEPNTSGIVLPTSYRSPMEEESDRISQSRVVGKANTDLLFSLFRGVSEDNSDREKRAPVVKRGRPRKMKPLHQASGNLVKDEDPYFTSAIVPVIQAKEEEKIAQEQQVLALISVSGENENYPINSSYTERLSDLVVNL